MNEKGQRQAVNDSAAVRASKNLIRDMQEIANQRDEAWEKLINAEQYVDEQYAKTGNPAWGVLKRILGGEDVETGD